MILLLSASYLLIYKWEQSLIVKKSEILNKYQKIYSLAQENLALKKKCKNPAPILRRELMSFVQNFTTTLKVRDRLETIKPVSGKVEGIYITFIKLGFEETIDILNLVNSKYSNVIIKSFKINARIDDPEFSDMQIYLEKI